MLAKLLKYDLKYMLKNMSPFYILGVIFAILTRIFFSIENSLICEIIGQICVGTMFSMLISILINTMMRSWVRFRDFLYKDESYLTHTLPVTKNDLYNSQFLQSLIFFVVGFVVVVISLFIAYYTEARWLMLKEFVNALTSGLNVNTIVFVVSMLIVIFLEIFNAIQCGFLGLIFGHKQNNSKVFLSICFGFVVYMIAQTLILAMMFIVALFDKGLMEMFTSAIFTSIDSLMLLINLTIVLYTLIIIVMSIVCKKVLNKGIDVE